MKAKLRKEQKERMKTSISNQSQKTNSDNKSQENIKSETKKKKGRNRSAEIPNGIFSGENMSESKQSITQKEIDPINKEEYKEQELSKIATMFNFEIDKDKDIIRIKENNEYYDMRNQIIQLEKELENSQREYNNLLNQYEKKNEEERQQISELENELKRHVDFDIEKLKKDNIILNRDINILDKKLDSANVLYQKEKYDLDSTIFELDNIIRKLKGEIYFVDDLKMRLKSLTSKDIPQELVDSINFVLKEDIAAQYKHIPTHSNIASVRSRTGTIPIADILDTSSIDSKKSEKKLYI
jgi:hypothetical protein